ncbi:hypothetical protein CLV62_14415 [Dysgonomonas alginatilytica]|uniref:Uncharacterized protein n=2 Tax=Dysgonomonas alginatilytica TaxID=1605892 RepID=A0A2V3PIM5_9BACT|nr:hypothetical protein CLV62_14415 [Dysgonomonas alginatilytica]
MQKKWTKIEEESFLGMNISSYRTESAMIEDNFDFALIFNSYDSRSLEYAKLFNAKQINNAVLINFQSDKPVKDTNYNKNKENLRLLIKADNIIEPEYSENKFDIFDYKRNITDILALIPEDAIFNGAKWFIDITGIPNIYLISLLKVFKQIYPSPDLHILNVSGNYQSIDTEVHMHFSKGISKDIYIPYFAGQPDFSKPWKYIFLLGFEGDRSLSILKKCEPISCVAIVADPGYAHNYKEMALKNNECFLKEVGLKNDDLIFSDVGNIIEIYKIINNIYINIKGEMNLCIVPLGPKTHALGAGLFGYVNSEISIMYQVPQKYFLKEIKRGKYMWLYKIK